MHIYYCPKCKINSDWCIEVVEERRQPENNVLRCFGCGWKGVMKDLIKKEIKTKGE